MFGNDEAALLERSAAHPLDSEEGMKQVSVSSAIKQASRADQCVLRSEPELQNQLSVKNKKIT